VQAAASVVHQPPANSNTRLLSWSLT
jgi:hypothetical protein